MTIQSLETQLQKAYTLWETAIAMGSSWDLSEIQQLQQEKMLEEAIHKIEEIKRRIAATNEVRQTMVKIRKAGRYPSKIQR